MADGNKDSVSSIHLSIQWTTVSAISAMASLPGKGEIYIRDQLGHPKALHGLMEEITVIRHDRYLTHKDNVNGSRYYWQDNTLALAVSIFYGNTNSAGHHAHTARMLYNEHWHGRNRAKNT